MNDANFFGLLHFLFLVYAHRGSVLFDNHYILNQMWELQEFSNVDLKMIEFNSSRSLLKKMLLRFMVCTVIMGKLWSTITKNNFCFNQIVIYILCI